MTTEPKSAPSWIEDLPDWVQQLLEWFVGLPLRIALILVGAMLIRFVAARLINRTVRAMLNANVKERPGSDRRIAAALHATRVTSLELLNERRKQRSETVGSILRSVVSFFVYGIAFVMILGEFDIDLGPIVASAGVLGVALGFGAQTLVKDFLAGIFMVLEDQYGVGDWIDTGSGFGVVEEVGLRITRIRDYTGVLWYVRNGEVMRIGNYSQGWSLADVRIPISYDADLERVREIVAEVGQEMLADPELAGRMLEAPSVAGLEEVAGEAVILRVWGKCAPMEQWGVQRELRERLKRALDADGVPVPVLIKPFLASPTDNV